ncbi:hypothetical protein FBU59_000572 [Linderina macrospora]|uniref:Uncharacterized protein n=1 Tax=Linderina macrospora TaxID=4868 RepID=A0ACC1JGP9_9FUNG|nr:hypothetical protein FBU59_000572 [Linderina macrospora]
MPSDPADIFDAAINTSQQSQQPTEAPAVEPEIASGIDAQQVPSDPADIFDAAISQSQPAVTEAPSVLQPADVPAPITHEDTPVKDPSLLSQESTVEAEAPVSTASIEQPPAAATVEETAASLPELSVATTAAVDTASDFYTQLSGGGQDAVAAEVPVEVQPAREQAVGNAAEPVASHETAWGTLTTQAVAQEDGFSQVTTQPAQIPTSSVDSTGYDYSSFYNDQQDSAVDAGAAVAAVATIGVESLDQQTPTSDAFAAVLPETGLQQDPSAPFNAYNPYSSTGYSQAPATSSGFERVTDFSSPVGAVDAQQQQQQQQQDPTAVYGAYDPYSSAGYSQAPAVSAGFETVADLTVPADTSATDTYQQQQQQPQDPNVGYGAYDPYTSAGYSQAPVANGEYAAMDTTAVPAASAGDYQQQQQQPADTTQYGMYDPYSSAGYPDSSAPNGAFAAVDTQAIDRGFEETGYAPFDPYSSGGYAQNDTSNGQQFGTYDPYSPAGVYSQAPAEDGAAVPAVTSAEDDHQQQGYAMYDPYNPTGGYSQAPVANDGFTVGDTAKQTQPDSGSAYGTYDPYNPTGFQQQAPPQQGDYTSPQTMSPKFGGVSSPHGSAQMATPLSFGHPSDPHVQDTRSVMVPTAVAPPAGIFDLQSHSERTSTDLSFDRDVNEPSMEATALQDPLGRLHGQRPIMSFGFGGQLFTMFPRQVQRFNMYGNGSGGSASKLAPGMVRCQLLSEHIAPELSAQNESAIFSSPLLAGETARAALLKRRDVAVACAKAWVDHAKDSMSDEEAALYNAVVAVLESFSPADTAMPELTHAVNALTPLFAQTQTELSATAESATAPLTHGSPADLQELEELLLAGRREDAVALACRQGMWAHALIIASCTGKGLWQSVVSAYTEGVLHDRASPLGLQYRLFSGLGAQAIDPPRPFDKRDASAAVEFVTAADMRGSDIGANAQNPSAAQPDSALQDWAKTLALVLANRTPGDHSAILQLGDKLRQDRRILPAHICYALALHAKDVFLSDPARAVLLGANEVPTANDAGSFDARADRFSRFYRNQSAICLTELYEVAVALTAATTSDAQTASTSPAPQGSKPPIQVMCLPHLQAYKLYRAWWLVDCGQTALASRYCDAVLGILATLPQGVATPFIHASLVQGLRELRGRLTGAGMSSAKAAELVGDEAAIAGGQKSWLARAMPRPSFTSLMSAFDSSIDKFITGADGHRISLDAAGPTPGKYEVGPDKHAADRSSADFPSQPRALGAVNFDSRTPSPRAQQVPGESAGASSEPYVPMFAVSPKAAPSRTSTDMYRTSMDQPRSSMDHHYSRITSLPQQHQAPAWGDPGNASDLGNDGFIMPAAALGGLTPGFSAAPPVHPAMSAPTGGAPSPATGGAVNDDDDEDMFGFSKKPAKKPDTAAPRHSIDTRSSAPPASRPSTDSAVASSAAARKSTDAKPDAEAKDGSGVLGLFKSLWGGRKNQANLGDDSGFVYDPVQQRWVNKNAKEDQADQAPLPPPPPANMNFAPQSSSVPPPAQLGTPPASGHTPMMGAGGGVPPMMMGGSRPASAVPPMMGGSAGVSRAGTPAGKRRGARTKYVDLLNQ